MIINFLPTLTKQKHLSAIIFLYYVINGGNPMFKILVVEDDKDLNRTVCSFLNQSGYEATGCLNGDDAGCGWI